MSSPGIRFSRSPSAPSSRPRRVRRRGRGDGARGALVSDHPSGLLGGGTSWSPLLLLIFKEHVPEASPWATLFSLSTLLRGQLRAPTTSNAALAPEPAPPPCTAFRWAFQELLSLNSSPPTLLLLREETDTVHESQGLDSSPTHCCPLLSWAHVHHLLPHRPCPNHLAGPMPQPSRSTLSPASSSPHPPLPQGLGMCYSSTLNTSPSLTAWPAPTHPSGRKLLFHPLTTHPSQATAPPHGSQHSPVPCPLTLLPQAMPAHVVYNDLPFGTVSSLRAGTMAVLFVALSLHPVLTAWQWSSALRY